MKLEEVNIAFLPGEVDRYVAPVVLSTMPCYEVGRNYFRTINDGLLGGFDFNLFNDLSQIYDAILDHDRDIVMAFSHNSIQYFNATESADVLVNQSKIIFRVKGKNNKIHFYLRHGIVNGVRDGKLVSNYSYLEDVTWMKPKVGAWQLMGKESEFFDFNIPEILSFKGVLSASEIKVLKLVARGFHSRDIAEQLFISRHTVATHRRNMIKKMDVAITAELLSLARDMGLLG